jgi:hypothetical protein
VGASGSGELDAESEEIAESEGSELSLEPGSVCAGSGELAAEADADEEFGVEVEPLSESPETGAEDCPAAGLESACALVMGLRSWKPNSAITASASTNLNQRRPITACTSSSPCIGVRGRCCVSSAQFRRPVA